MIHELKCWPEYMDAMLDGRKKFEVRNTSDRAFSVGDGLHLREYDPREGIYLSREMLVRVTYILTGRCAPIGLAIMGIEPIVDEGPFR